MHPFYKNFKDLSQDEVNQEFLNACKYKNLETIRYLLTTTELKFNADINIKKGYALQLACEGGDLAIVKYLINSPELKEHIIINENIDEGFLEACMHEGNKGFELVKYLLISPELKKHADINIDNGQGFIIACNKGNLELVKYLTSSSDLKEHINPHTKDDLGFRLALQNSITEEKGSLEILNYLIFDLKIEQTEKIKKALITKKYLFFNIKKSFDIRDLKQELNTELLPSQSAEKKIPKL
jgi:ankyrin repeat protein